MTPWLDDGDVRCACGCGGTVQSPDAKGRPRLYLRGHNLRVRQNIPPDFWIGRKHTPETCRRLSRAAQARATSTTPAAGRAKARRDIPMTELCERCGRVPPYDRHHIDNDTHNNQRSNILCLCRRCHQTIDGRRDWLIHRNREGVSQQNGVVSR